MKDIFVFESEPIAFDALRSGRSTSGIDFGPRAKFFEQEFDFEGGGTSRVAACGAYEPGEVQKSNTNAGILPSDFFPGPSGYYLLADFAVGSSAIKDAAKNDSELRKWLTHHLDSAAKDPSVSVKVLGYTDCVNKENRNTKLRADRARQVRRLIETLAGNHPGWRSLRTRITDGPPPPDQYLRDNNNPANRATNRGVSLEVTRILPIEPLAVNCRADFLHRAANLLQTARAKKLMEPARHARIVSILRQIKNKTKDDRYVTHDDVNAVARSGIKNLKWRTVTKFLDDVCAAAEQNDKPITDDEILHELWRLDNGLMSGICRLVEFKQNRATTRMRASINALIATVFGLMKNPASVYLGYQNAETECPTRSKPGIIPPPKKKDPKDPQGGTPPRPDPKNQTVPTDHSIWDDLKRIAKMSGILMSAAMLLMPGAVVARAVMAAAVFLLRGFTARQLVGMAGEAAARVIAEYTLTRAGIPATRIFNLNTIRMNFPGIDLITPLKPISVKAYGIITKYTGDELNKRVLSRYLSDFLKLAGSETYQEKYRIRVANGILQAKKAISKAGALPSGLSGNLGVNSIIKYIRDETIFMIPSDHVVLFHQYAGSRLLAYYKQFGLPGIPSGLTNNAVAPRISKMLADRFQSMGVKSTDLQLMLKAAKK